jgi:hypothetical protein
MPAVNLTKKAKQIKKGDRPFILKKAVRAMIKQKIKQ